MCGIAGYLSTSDRDPLVIDRMIAALRHRGPDDQGCETVGSISLGSTRLSIIDLSPAGHMPMVDAQTGNRIVFNGEIYNFRELRHELQSRGCNFHSGTDTEVALKAYAVWGVHCVEWFRGMFAIAIWDAGCGELFLARDRMGEKPLYYFEDVHGGRFLFASEIRSLLASGCVPRRLDPATVRSYLHNGFTIAPRTLLSGVNSLLPGYWMRVSGEGAVMEARRYWQLPDIPNGLALPAEDEIRSSFEEAVRMRLISDVPLGAFLSGGLDSSALVAMMARCSNRVKTFSIGFAEVNYDETPYAEWVARKFGTDHISVRVGPAEFAVWLDDALAGMDQPTYDGLNTYCVARAARESGLRVALSGLGGDELFGGYPSFRTARLISRLAQWSSLLPVVCRRAMGTVLGGTHGASKAFHIHDQDIPDGKELLAGYQTAVALFASAEQRPLQENIDVTEANWFGLPPDFLRFIEAEDSSSDDLTRLSHYTLRLFEGERALRDSDSVSMAVSLELRTVFTDHRLIENLWRIPGGIRCAGAPDKPFQERLFRPILGADYPYRPKQGFIFPFAEWMQLQGMREKIEDTLRDRSLVEACGLSPSGIRSLAKRKAGIPWSRVWSVFVLLDWVRRHRVAA